MNESSKVAIITLFEGQKSYLLNKFKSLNLNIPVYLLAEIEVLQKDIILFSPVYTQTQPRPYLLDEGEAPLKKLQACAKQFLYIFADRTIFDPHTHTPSGQLAKIFEKETLMEKSC